MKILKVITTNLRTSLKTSIFLLGSILIYLMLIFIGSSLSSVPVPQLMPYQDKLEHFVEYFILGIILFLNYKSRIKINKIISMFILFSWPILDEFHQSFVPMRDASIFDAMADYVGMIVAILLFHFLFNLVKSDVK